MLDWVHVKPMFTLLLSHKMSLGDHGSVHLSQALACCLELIGIYMQMMMVRIVLDFEQVFF